MLSVRELRPRMLQLDKEDYILLRNVPLKKVVLYLRKREYYRFERLIRIYNPGKHILKRDIRELRAKMLSEMKRLDMFRTDFYDSERFKISANIMALLDLIDNYPNHRGPHFFYSADFIPRLITEIPSNEVYEEWQGFSDDEMARILTFLRMYLSERELLVVCLRFGILDGRCMSHQEIYEKYSEFSSKESSSLVFREAIRKLNYHKDSFASWMELCMTKARE